MSRETVLAELELHARSQGLAVADLLPRKEARLGVALERVLDLTNDVNLAAVGLTNADIESKDWRRCQAIGDAAHYVGFEGVLAPSSTGVGTVLAVFVDRMTAASTIEIIEETEILDTT